MNWLVSTSLRLRVIVVALAVLLMVVGLRVVRSTPLDVFPEFAPPLVEIQTEAPGLSTAEVESLISVPIENALNGTAQLKTLRSKTVLGLSSVVLIFEQGTELMPARQRVQERLALVAPQLPAAARPPVILQPLSSTSRAMKIGLSSKKLSQTELSTLARWTVRPRLMAVPGVANVAIWGQRDRQLQVLVEPDRLRAHNVTLTDVERATRDAVSVAAGGFVDTPNQRLSVTHVAAVTKPQDLARVPVAFRSGAPLPLGAVAEVVEGNPPPIGDAIINDGPGILLIVEKQPEGNTLDVTRNVEAALEALKPGLKDVLVDSTIFRPATFIEVALRNLRSALLVGCLLVILVLVVFLFEWRTAVISLSAIPLSLLAAAMVLYWRGYTINTMVIAGLVIALGEVVDDAIIDVENIMRRLKLNREAGNPESAFSVVLKASLEVRSAIVFATLIVVLVFLPIFFLDGLSGSFFRPLAISYVLAVLASLAVALTLTPALSLLLLPRAAHRKQEPALTRFLKRLYRRVLPAFIGKPKLSVAAMLLLFGLTAAAIPFLGEEFLPNFKETDFLMHWVEKPGTSLEAMDRITIRASKELRAIPGVRNFGSHIGRAEVADEVVGPNFTELWISIDPNAPYEPTVAKIQEVVDGYPGLVRDLLTYLKERIKEVLTGAGASVVVRIYGPDLEGLRAKAAEVGKVIGGVQGVANLKIEQQVSVPQIEVRLKPAAAARFGLTPGDVRRAATTLIKGQKVGELYEAQQINDVVVWGAAHTRTDLEAIRRLRIGLPAGGDAPLGDVADVYIAPAPNVIQHEGASRRIDVTCDVKGRDLGSVAREVESKVKTLSFDRGYHPEFLGEFAARQASKNRLFALAGLALLGILLLLHADFRSGRLVTLVAVSLPFALIGGVAATLLTGGVLSLGSLVGFVTVLGIAARNGIMLVSHYRHLETEEGQAFGKELVLRGSEERLAPILMTALATGLALLPIVLSGNKPGHEIEHPLAVVILGGLVTSTLLNLFVMPALYLRFGARKTPEVS
ncbi:MAG TPA: efflux RND transporter permease subunit [Blastocatellia bacterium]|nr:efflux RND transporter permease subunit [Blastocatellia bacterium]HMX28542.1 efflux RND transporter permease subunit [Blastocatellia bacterium]HMZ19433.1 efflux RND transporter permease subunit [Blastocatellia bacterium]HNG32400.1 efflux RND transporter permease subunit [Blastocatellia bacterium]